MSDRIISFSLFGDKEKYLIGIRKNIEQQKIHFPDWVCRVYVSDEIPEGFLDEITGEGAQVVRMFRRHPYDGLMWRFLPAADPSIDYAIFRDADSRISARDFHAVNDWIASGKTYHLLRDHPLHRKLIMAGLWGCKGGAIPDIQQLITGYGQFSAVDCDQDFLARVIYPKVRKNVMIHTDWAAFDTETVTPFPTPRENNEYLGSPHEHEFLSEEDIERHSQAFASRTFKTRPLPEFVLETEWPYRLRRRLGRIKRKLLGNE